LKTILVLNRPFNIGIFKSLRLKHVGLILASVWVLILVAAVATSIYRNIDGPTVTKVMANNIHLTEANSVLNDNLGSARALGNETKGKLSSANSMINDLMTDLHRSRTDISNLKHLFQSYITSIPLTTFSPETPGSLGKQLVQ
jgi:hypothetical protein